MSISASNAALTIAVSGLFAAPQTIQGFDVDDAFESETLDVAETKVGVDGNLSAGLVYDTIKMGIILQADSVSLSFFETWYTTEMAQQDKLVASGTLRLQGPRRSYALTTGYLRQYTPFSSGKKVLQPRRFMIEWAPPLVGVPF